MTPRFLINQSSRPVKGSENKASGKSSGQDVGITGIEIAIWAFV